MADRNCRAGCFRLQGNLTCDGPSHDVYRDSETGQRTDEERFNRAFTKTSLLYIVTV